MWLINRVTVEDSEQLFKWRNSPEVYRLLFNPVPVEKNGHEKWIKNIVNNSLVAFYKVSYQGNDIGTVRFDFEDNFESAEVGIYLAPEYQGQGLGNQMLDFAEKKVVSEYKELKKIIAKVIPENIASEKMFLKTGYDKKFIQLEKKYE